MIGERLLELRKDARMTQDDLAAILNMNKHSIFSYDRDKSEPPDAIKIAIARYFDVSVDYWPGLTDNPTPVNRERTVVKLPSSFPEQSMSELQGYIEYLVYRSRSAK